MTGTVSVRNAYQTGDAPNVEAILTRLKKLHSALESGSSREQCLRRWSEFVRERDGHRCVDCHAHDHLSAHHICRKSLLAAAQFQTGNGITLCRSCHGQMHLGFNGRPNLDLPIDAQGAEKLPHMERLFSILTDDAVERGLTREEFYFLDNEVLARLKLMQGYEPDTYFPGAPIEQAYLIRAECERGIRVREAEAAGCPPPTSPLLPGGLYMVFPEEEYQPRRTMVIQTYVPRWRSP